MKKNLLSYSLVLIFLFLLSGCRAPNHLAGGDAGGRTENDDQSSHSNEIQAGQLTAAEWSDLKNYNFYLSLFESSQTSANGIFSAYYNKGYFDTLNMVEVTVQNGDTLLKGASVELYSANQNLIYQAKTNIKGVAYLFPQSNEVDSITEVVVKYGDNVVREDYEYSQSNNVLEIEMGDTNTIKDIIEIMFVVDTTGSMGDEIDYLKAEIDYVISEVKTLNPNTTVRLALLFYRDISDEYITRYFDFTTDIEIQQRRLAEQTASGGGDFEEAVDVALDEAVSKAWSDENTTKLLFHVLDAPPHYTKQNMTKYFQAIYNASKKGIHMIPVASSGIDKYTEYLLRNEAMMTGGTYVFLTDDSGIGEDHLEASVGEVVIEYLNNLLVRLINEYHTGVEGKKIPYYQQNN
jgi:signal peptidase I